MIFIFGITRYSEKVRFVNHTEIIFSGEGGASFWASENYTGQVHFESHLRKWQVLSQLSFEHWVLLLVPVYLCVPFCSLNQNNL